MEHFISDDKGMTGFVTKNKPKCPKGGDHQWDGDEIITFHNDERILLRSELFALPQKEQEALNMASGQVSCSKCGIGYMEYDNPWYSEI